MSPCGTPTSIPHQASQRVHGPQRLFFNLQLGDLIGSSCLSQGHMFRF